MIEKQPQFLKVSIIIPVYNKQEYIQDCLSSILNQSLKEIEIICIDDGSTDDSSTIIEACQSLDNRIVLLHQKNQGAGPARNAGIQIARGTYIAFMDPDDWYPDDYVLEDLYHIASKNVANICGGSLAEYVDGNLRTSYPDERQKYIFNKTELIHYKDYQYDYGYHRFLYRRDFVLENELTFPAYRRFQDPPFFVKAMVLSNSFWAVNRISYIYRVAYKAVNWDAKKLGHLARGLADVITTAAHANLDDLCSLEISRIKRSYLELFFEAMQWERCPEEYLTSLKSLINAIRLLEPSNASNYVDVALSNLIASIKALDACRLSPPYEKPTNTQTPLISVIIPVYNDERHLEACISSVLNQTLSQFEIIIVNDGSTDGSLQLAERFVAGDSRITVISKENGGLSTARNAGLATAKGVYIQFLDSDDLLMPQTLETLYRLAESQQLDQLFFSAISFFASYDCLQQNQSYLTYYHYPSFVDNGIASCPGQELFCRLSEAGEFKPSACMQLIRKEFLVKNDIYFYPGILHEDNLFTMECLTLSERSAVTPQKFYLRRVHDSSIMTSSQGVKNSYGYYKTVFEIVKFISDRNIVLHSSFEKHLINRLEVYIRQAGRLYGLSDNITAMKYMQNFSPEENLLYRAIAQCYLKIKGTEIEARDLLSTEQEKLRNSQIKLKRSQTDLTKAQTELKKVQEELKKAQSESDNTQTELKKVQKKLKKAQSEFKRVQTSNSWKIGRTITAPIRFIKRLIKKIKNKIK